MITDFNSMIHDNIIKRRSPVVYSGKEVEQEKIDLMFEAAKWAPSSFNEQPWRFIYAKSSNKMEYNRFLNCLYEGNRIWAKHAPLLVLSIAKLDSSNGRPNFYAMYDTGMAVGNLLSQATYNGLYVHQMGGYDKDKAREVLNIPEVYQPLAMMAIGYLGNIDNFPKDIQEREKRERTRKEIQEFVHVGQFAE